MKITLSGMVLAFLSSSQAWSLDLRHNHAAKGCAEGGGFLPPNRLDLEDRRNLDFGVTEAEFTQVINRANDLYGPIVKSHNGSLKINALWENSTVNASATQGIGVWEVNMYGGLARRPEVSIEGFTLVLCHEIGHHLAGYSFVSRWAANEGESDYFATQSCARELWKDELQENARAVQGLPAQAKSSCDQSWAKTEDRQLCYRVMKGSESLASLLASLSKSKINWDDKDNRVVKRTNNSHPQAQCRFDTYRAGALCTKDFDIHVIPGKKLGSQRNSPAAEKDANLYSCATIDDFSVGTRPLCWFKPLLRGLNEEEPEEEVDDNENNDELHAPRS